MVAASEPSPVRGRVTAMAFRRDLAYAAFLNKGATMKRIAILFGIVVLAGCRGGNSTPPEPEPVPPLEWSADMQAVADGNNHFALELYGKLSEAEKGKNLFFSPYSIHTALGMTATGAKGTTRDQMVKVLHLPEDEQKALACGDLGRYYAQPRKAFELAVANSVWGQSGFPWRAEFLTLQKERFGAGFREADFRTNPDTERVRINKWVESKTHDRVKDLLRPEHIDKQTRMVLANAIYFKGTWTTQFPTKKTRDVLFHLADGGRINVPTMYEEVKCRWGLINDVPGAKILELPYSGGELSMVVLLPKLPDGLPAIERRLAPDALSKWLEAMYHPTKPVGVSLPKFRFERSYDLPEKLKALGMVDAFIDGMADLTGMTEVRLCITAVAHKAYIDVNEEGSEAAAATAVVVSESFGDPPAFTIEHPFLFLIRDVKHGTILFLGRVTNPKG